MGLLNLGGALAKLARKTQTYAIRLVSELRMKGPKGPKGKGVA